MTQPRSSRHAPWPTPTAAPLRETDAAIEAAESAGIHAVEMEAAALYAYATARQRDVFEKGDDYGTHRILGVVDAIADRWSNEH